MSTSPIAGLSVEHYAELSIASSISDEIIRERGYATVRAAHLPTAFADYQRRDGLLIPIGTVRGKIESYQLKPNDPRIGKNGKAIKYETAANALQVLDVPVSVVKYLGNPQMPLVITEGAKKVDSALTNGIDCVIGLQGVYGWRGKNEHGGKAALPDWELIALNGRKVFIAFDSDVMTKQSVRSALDRLSGFLASKGAKVGYIVMPDLPDGSKCGLDDWFASGRNRDELARLHVTELPVIESKPSPKESSDVPRIVSRSMREIEAQEIAWLWPGWLPKGMLSLLGGYAGDGKSTLTAALAATFSTGAPLPDGSTAPITNTMLVLTEDDVSHVVKKRLAIHGLDEDRVHTLDYVQMPDRSTRLFNLKTDVPLLREEILEKQIGFIVIDPLSGVMGSSDHNNEGEMREVLTKLANMAEETGCAVMGITNIGKTDDQVKSFQKVMGSTALTAVARTVWMLSELPADYQTEGEPVKRMLGVSKSNYSVPPKPLQYVRPKDQAIVWLGESPLGIDAVFSKLKKTDDEGGKSASETEKAEEWLLEQCSAGPRRATELEADAKEEGISRSSLYRVKKGIGILSKRRDGVSFWQLPEADEVAA